MRIYNESDLQIGNLPNVKPDDDYNIYNRTNLQYRYGIVRAFTRFELFQTRYEQRNYYQFTQYRIELKYEGWQFKAGHFYDMFGRGLLLRAYEIPESIYEDSGYRVRQGFYRDIYGVSGAYNSKTFSIRSFYGKPLINLFPPTLDDELRRRDILAGISSRLRLNDFQFFASYINNSGKNKEEFTSLGISGPLSDELDFYGEYAHENNNFTSLTGNDRYGIYGNLNFYFGPLGVSLEYKSYNKFLLGSGYNDPPNLVKEHSYPVLNRSTHIIILENESGFQVETYFKINTEQTLTANISMGRNALYQTKRYVEYFGQWESRLDQNQNVILFVDYSADENLKVINRVSAGGVWERPLFDEWYTTINLESQLFERQNNRQNKIYNLYASVSVEFNQHITGGVIIETSNDPYLTDNPYTTTIETGPRFWYGANLAYRPGPGNRFELFAGQRRGGPSCTSGICYEVLDFEGIELKWVTRI